MRGATRLLLPGRIVHLAHQLIAQMGIVTSTHARRSEYQTAPNLLRDMLNLFSDQLRSSTRPARPRRVTPFANHQLRIVHARREQRSRRGSRPRETHVHRDIARPTPAASRPLRSRAKRNAIVRAKQRPRRGCPPRRVRECSARRTFPPARSFRLCKQRKWGRPRRG
jgi:hypothetical protein